MTLLKPPRLKKGDTLAVIRPSSRLQEDEFENTLRGLRKAGFCVAVYEDRLKKKREKKELFFAASDEWRSAEWDWAFREPGIRAVLAARGGYGIQRTLAPFSESRGLAAARRHWRPKVVVGYSDFTFAHQWIQNQLGWMTFHGPLVGSLKDVALQHLMNDLLGLSSAPQVWTLPETRASQIGRQKLVKPGNSRSAEGRLVGGNLSLLQTAGLAELPREPIILAIEDVNESFYRLDRFLMNLWYAGYGRYVRGILLGSFYHCGKADARSFQWTRVCESMRRLTVGPIVSTSFFGHGLSKQRLLPLGMRVRLSDSSLRFLEPWTTS